MSEAYKNFCPCLKYVCGEDVMLSVYLFKRNTVNILVIKLFYFTLFVSFCMTFLKMNFEKCVFWSSGNSGLKSFLLSAVLMSIEAMSSIANSNLIIL